MHHVTMQTTWSFKLTRFQLNEVECFWDPSGPVLPLSNTANTAISPVLGARSSKKRVANKQPPSKNKNSREGKARPHSAPTLFPVLGTEPRALHS